MKQLIYFIAFAAAIGLEGKSFAKESHRQSKVATESGSRPHEEEADDDDITGSISTKGVSPAEYPKRAKVSSSEAVTTATSLVTGKVVSVSLENEDGFLIYAVEVINPTSGSHEILVDAGNGKILRDEQKDGKTAHR